MNSSERSNVLLTGSTGFVGKAVLKCLTEDISFAVRAALRRQVSGLNIEVDAIKIGALGPETNWKSALPGIDVVIHMAARVHVMKDAAGDSLAEFRQVNVEGTFNLARQAAAASVKRFIFISSIKVNGEKTFLDKPYRDEDVPAPVDPYGISKCEAEDKLRLLAEETGMEVVIIRPPLVYGPGVKANFLSMMRWLDKRVPLPLGAIHNKRSLVALDNLVDLIVTCIKHPAAANQTFLAGDGEDLSTTELLQRMGKALGKPTYLLPAPAWLLKTGALLLGKRDMAQRLLGSLQVDISKARNLLGWTPPVCVDDALKKTAQYYLEHQKK